MSLCVAALMLASLQAQVLPEPPRYMVAIVSTEVDEATLKRLWAAKDPMKEGEARGFTFAQRGDVGFYIQKQLTLGERIKNTKALLGAILASTRTDQRGVTDTSKLAAADKERVKHALADYKPYLPSRLRSAVDSGTLKFAVEPNAFVRATVGERTISFVGSLGGKTELGGFLNETVDDQASADSAWINTTIPGGKVSWHFGPGFRRQSLRLRALRDGGELLWAASEDDLRKLDDAWREVTNALGRQYADAMGELPSEADTYSKLGPLMQNHLMLSFARDFSMNGFGSRIEAETWLQGATIKDAQLLLFVAVGVKEPSGQISRVSFPLIHP